MKVIKETIGNVNILIQTMDNDLEVINETQEGPAIIDTSIEDKLQEIYTKAKLVIRNMAEGIGSELVKIAPLPRPKQVELEFTMGISAQAGIWILSSGGEHTLAVKMIWELAGDESTN